MSPRLCLRTRWLHSDSLPTPCPPCCLSLASLCLCLLVSDGDGQSSLLEDSVQERGARLSQHWARWRQAKQLCLGSAPITLRGFPGGSEVKNPPAVQEPQETGVRSLGREPPLEEGMAAHSSIPAWRIPWTEESGVYSPQDHSQIPLKQLSRRTDTLLPSQAPFPHLQPKGNQPPAHKITGWQDQLTPVLARGDPSGEPVSSAGFSTLATVWPPEPCPLG